MRALQLFCSCLDLCSSAWAAPAPASQLETPGSEEEKFPSQTATHQLPAQTSTAKTLLGCWTKAVCIQSLQQSAFFLLAA